MAPVPFAWGSCIGIPSLASSRDVSIAAVVDVVDDEGGVVTDAVDEVGVASVLEPLADDVQPVVGGDPARLHDLAGAVEHGQTQPLVGPDVAGGPDHRAYPL